MKIKFTHDFQGKLTNEMFYLEGTEIEYDDEIAAELISLNHAVLVEDDPPKKKQILPEEKPEGSTGSTAKAGKRVKNKPKPRAKVEENGS